MLINKRPDKARGRSGERPRFFQEIRYGEAAAQESGA